MSYKKSIDEINLYYKQSGIAKKMLLLESIGLGAIAEYVHSGVLEDKSLLAGSSVVFASIIYNILKYIKAVINIWNRLTFMNVIKIPKKN